MLEVKALGQTIEQNGNVVLVVAGGDLPPDCMVIFIALEDWERIKEDVILTNK